VIAASDNKVLSIIKYYRCKENTNYSSVIALEVCVMTVLRRGLNMFYLITTKTQIARTNYSRKMIGNMKPEGSWCSGIDVDFELCWLNKADSGEELCSSKR
jgi:hypothetical protein